jgi:hypothetical protein
MRYCAGLDTIVADSPNAPVGRTHAATVRPSDIASRSPSLASKYEDACGCACHAWPAMPGAYHGNIDGVGTAVSFPSASTASFSNRHHAARLSPGATQTPVPTR